MHIQFLYYEDCPSHDTALDRLHNVMQSEGIEANVEVIKVETVEQAESLRFVGSPTIRIDGDDIDPPPPETPYRLTCRAYRRPDGRITPLPSPDLIRHALVAHCHAVHSA